MKFDGNPSNVTPLPENVSVTFTFLTNDLENLINLWPDCRKYLRKFLFKCIQWFRSYRVPKISMATAGRP